LCKFIKPEEKKGKGNKCVVVEEKNANIVKVKGRGKNELER
jgi:hypothetical protein